MQSHAGEVFPDTWWRRLFRASFVARNRDSSCWPRPKFCGAHLGAAFWSYEPTFPRPFFRAHPGHAWPAHRSPAPQPQRRIRAVHRRARDARDDRSHGWPNWCQTCRSGHLLLQKPTDAGPGLLERLEIRTQRPARLPQQTRRQTRARLMSAILRGARRVGRNSRSHDGQFFADRTGSRSHGSAGQTRSSSRRQRSHRRRLLCDQWYPVRGVLIIGGFERTAGIESHDIKTVFAISAPSTTPATSGWIPARRSRNDREFLQSRLRAVRCWLRQALVTAGSALRGRGAVRSDVDLHEALNQAGPRLPRLRRFTGRSSVYITRPVVVLPERLMRKRKRTSCARVKRHRAGAREITRRARHAHLAEWIHAQPIAPVTGRPDPARRLKTVRGRSRKFDSLSGVTYWRKTATAPLYGNVLRSCGNFFAVQIRARSNPSGFRTEAFSVARAAATGIRIYRC